MSSYSFFAYKKKKFVTVTIFCRKECLK